MKYWFQTLIIVLILACGVLGQTNAEYKEFDLGFMKITIPAFLVDQKPKCYDGGCWRYEGEGLRLTIDHNVDCYRPTFERTDPAYDYSEEFLVIDGVNAKLWNLRGGKFMSGANYGIEKDNKIGLGIILSSDDSTRERTKEIAKKIFLSIKFTPKKNKS